MTVATFPVPAREDNALEVRIVRVSRRGQDWPLPRYQTSGSAGMDLAADIEAAITLQPLERATIPTGIAIQLPDGYEAQVRPRSGLSSRHGVTVVNAPGTIDSDYCGTIHVPVINLGQAPYTIHPGDRIAQMIVAPVMRVHWLEVPSLDPTARGAGGFGHTGR